MSRQAWANPLPTNNAYTRKGNLTSDVILVDSRSAPSSSPAPAPGSTGNPRGIVPLGWIRQIGSDEEVDTMMADSRSLVSISNYPYAVSVDRPAAYWRFDEPSGTVFVDSSGHSIPLVASGSGVALSQGGATADGDTAIAFDGITGSASTSSNQMRSLFQLQDFSVEFWASPAALANFVFSYGQTNNAGTDNFLHIGFKLGAVFVGFFGDDLQGLTAVPTNNYTHVVVTFNATTRVRTIYVNGVVDISAVATGVLNVPSGAVPNVGLAFFATGNGPFFYMGRVDELALYDYPLSAARVLAHFNAASQATLSSARYRANITQFVVPYVTGGWPPDPQAGQPGHTPQRPPGEG